MKYKKNVLIIVPAYNEEDNLRVFFEETNKIIQSLEDYIGEFLFIDDGSDDSTWKIIDEISNSHKSAGILQTVRESGFQESGNATSTSKSRPAGQEPRKTP